jgi:NAD(P)-dependent dehydrogenase (short-subunit alcohol dehydrogenase family)
VSKLTKGLLLGAAGLVAYGAVRRRLVRAQSGFFDGKSAVVTGGASGIGLAVVDELVARGARVMAVDINAEALDALRDALPSVETLQLDVTASDAPETIVSEAEFRFGRLDVVISNAGIVWAAPFLAMTNADVDRLVDVNFTSQVRLARAVLPVLLEQGGGVLAFTGSLSSRVYSPMHSVYTGTKGGLHGFVAAVRRELLPGSGVQVSIIHPNMTRTQLVAQELWDDVAERFPLQTAQQVAAAYLDGISAGRKEIYVEVTDNLLAWVEFVAPQIVDLVIRWKLSDDLKEKAEAIATGTYVPEGGLFEEAVE